MAQLEQCKLDLGLDSDIDDNVTWLSSAFEHCPEHRFTLARLQCSTTANRLRHYVPVPTVLSQLK